MYPYNKNTKTYRSDLEMKERMNGTPNETINGTPSRTIIETPARTQNGTTNGVQNGTTNGVQNGTTNGVQNGTNNGVQNGTNNRMQNGTNNRMQNGTNNGMQNGTNNGMQNGTTNRMQNGTPNGMQNDTLTENQRAALAEDEKLIEMLTLSQQESADMAERFASLMADPDMAPSATTLRAMYLDELKHINQLKDAYYLITGNQDETEFTGATPETSGQTLLEDTLLLEIDNGDFYRTLYLTMPTQDLRDIFYEMTTDKMRHGIALNYLFAKYFAG